MGGRLEQQKEEKKQSLLQSARELFLEKGPGKTSVDEIVRRANVAKGTFYLYFKDKNDLLQSVVDRICTHILRDAYEYEQRHKNPDFVENVVLIIDYIVEYFKRDKLTLRLLERNFSWPMVERNLTLQTDSLWQDLVRDLEASPLARNHSPEEMFKLLFMIFELCGSICYASIIEERPDTIDNMKPMLYGAVRKMLQ